MYKNSKTGQKKKNQKEIKMANRFAAILTCLSDSIVWLKNAHFIGQIEKIKIEYS